MKECESVVRKREGLRWKGPKSASGGKLEVNGEDKEAESLRPGWGGAEREDRCCSPRWFVRKRFGIRVQVDE